MTFEEYRKRFPATRGFQRYTSEQRANHASSHRLGHNKRIAVGEYFYAHQHAPGVCFPKRLQAERAGYDRHQQVDAAAPTPIVEQDAIEARKPSRIHLTHTGPAAGATLCGAPRDGSVAHHAVYAPVERDEYRAQCWVACLKEYAQAWAGEKTKPDWVNSVLAADVQDVVSTQLPLFA